MSVSVRKFEAALVSELGNVEQQVRATSGDKTALNRIASRFEVFQREHRQFIVVRDGLGGKFDRVATLIHQAQNGGIPKVVKVANETVAATPTQSIHTTGAMYDVSLDEHEPVYGANEVFSNYFNR